MKLSNYIQDISHLDNFELFKANPYGWSIDKDIKGGTYIGYYYEYLSLISTKENIQEASIRCDNYKVMHNEKAYSKRRKPIMGISLHDNTILLFKSGADAHKFNLDFDSSHISKCCNNPKKSHNGYRWKFVNYKHNKRYRKVVK